MAHVMIITDGMRRYARAHGLTVVQSYEKAAAKLVDLARDLLAVPSFDEVTFFLAAPYNLARDSGDVDAIRSGSEVFFKQLPAHIGMDVSVSLIGESETLAEFVPAAFGGAVRMSPASGELPKRFNILAFYDYYTACSTLEPPQNWRPFRRPIDLIFRFGQPFGLVRGSAIFPMSEQAYWHGVSDLFPDFPREDIPTRAIELLIRAGRLRTAAE